MPSTDGGTLLRGYMQTRALEIGRPETGLEHPSKLIGAMLFKQKIDAYWRKQDSSSGEIAKVRSIERHATPGHTGAIGKDSWWLVVAAFLLDLDSIEADELFKSKDCRTIGELRLHYDNDPKKQALLKNWPEHDPAAGNDTKQTGKIDTRHLADLPPVRHLHDLSLKAADELFEPSGGLAASQREDAGDREFDSRSLERRALAEGRSDQLSTGRPVPTHSRAVEDACRLVLLEAEAAERSGQIEVASKLYERAFDTSREVDALELTVRAALGGAGFSGRIGGQQGRLGRLQILFAEEVVKRSDRSREFDEVTVELAYELWAAQLPWDDRLEQSLRFIAERGDRVGLLARRMVLVLDDHRQRVGIERVAALVADAFEIGLPKDQGKCLVTGCHIAVCEGDWTLATQWVNQLEDVARRSGESRAQWQAATNRAALLDARGLVDEAEAEAARALELGQRFELSDAVATFGMLSVGRAFRGGELGLLRDTFEDTASRYHYPVWFALRGLAAVEADIEAASGLLLLAAEDQGYAIDPFRVASLALITILAFEVRDAMLAATAAEKLKEWSGRLVFLGNGGPFLGPVDWFLAHDAELRSDKAGRDQLLDQATASVRAAGAAAWLRAPIRTRW